MEIALRVAGLVQGVGFRLWTRALAIELGARGWVRNAEDGSVEVHAAGPPEVIQEMTRRLRLGPPHARVSSVEPLGPVRSLPSSGFEVRG